jgi:hypothetical protein
MPQLLLDRLIEFIKLYHPEDWRHLCHHAHEDEPGVSPESAARWFLRSFGRKLDSDPKASGDTEWLCWKCIDLFCDAFRNQMVGRKRGTLEITPLPPALITPETLRFAGGSSPDELVLDDGELIFVDVTIVDVRVEPAPASLPSPSAPPVRKPVMKGRLPSGRPPEYDDDAIAGVAKNCAKHGVEEFLARFVERVSHECGDSRPPIRAPKLTKMRDICRPIWDAARGESTKK